MRIRGFKPAYIGFEQEINISIRSDFLWKMLEGDEEKL